MWCVIFTALALILVSTPDVLALSSVLTNLPRSCYRCEAPIPEKQILLQQLCLPCLQCLWSCMTCATSDHSNHPSPSGFVTAKMSLNTQIMSHAHSHLCDLVTLWGILAAELFQPRGPLFITVYKKWTKTMITAWQARTSKIGHRNKPQ